MNATRRPTGPRLRASLGIATALVMLMALTQAADARDRRQPVSFTEQAAPLAEVELVVAPAVDVERMLAEDRDKDRGARGGPLRFAAPLEVSWSSERDGSWETLADGSLLWRLRIAAPGALSLNLALSPFELPTEGRLWLYDPRGEVVQGPFTPQDRTPKGELWTPLVPGDEVVVEARVPAGSCSQTWLGVARVNHGYRSLAKVAGSGDQDWCHNDVVCPEGDGWRDQIRAVGWFTLEGYETCSGTLVNNTSADLTPYFLTADHCDVESGNADTMVVYWNFESPTCGQLGGGSLADNQGGATWLASWWNSDFTLVELWDEPDPSFDVHYAGWDARTRTPSSAVGIHHPMCGEKAISFENDPLRTPSQYEWPSQHFYDVIDWDDGTTQNGSSGSCLFDPATGLCVGTLTGGYAACGNDESDWYGKLSSHFTGGGAVGSRLSDYLDKAGTGALTLAGTDPGGGHQDCVPDERTMCLNGGRFKVQVDFEDFDGVSGSGRVVPNGSDDSGLFWFFGADNWEMLVKVLDGCGVNDHYWVFAAATTNVEYTLTVTDTEEDAVRAYTNPLGTSPPALTDTTAFATCP